MRRFKLGFSLIFAIFLVGMLSTSAFAKDPYGLKPVQNYDLSLKVPFNGNSADATDIEGRSFDLVLKDDLGVQVGSTYTANLDASKKAIITIATGVMTPGKVYTVELFHSDDASHLTLLSKSTALVQDAANKNMYQTPDSHVDLDGSGLKNANSTGYNNTRKQRTGQKVHGFYQNNTNSCASCHQTHTGADEFLLFKEGTYSTCSACHDGTTGAYNSFAPVSEENVNSISGTFNVLGTDGTNAHNGSLHVADGSLNVSAAPGGNNSGTGQFNQGFDCASCHNPHGGGSASENNLSQDPLGWGSVAYGTATNDAKNGRLFTLTTIYTKAEALALTAMDTPYILVKYTVTADDLGQGADPTKFNYFFKRQATVDPTFVAGTDVIMTYRWNGSKKYVADYALWNREKGYPYKADTKLMDAASAEVTGLTTVWKDGFAYGANLATVTKAQLSVGIDVETTSNIATLFDSKATGYVPESGIQMSKYCASCHTDYLSATRNDETGVYSSAHRHQTASDSLTCVRCHYGHGTEAQIMLDANDNNYYELTDAAGTFKMTSTAAIDYLKDPNPSSALKRYTGMAVCYACHGGGSQFLGNQNNGTGAQALTGKLKAGQPGVEAGRTNY